MSDTQTTRVPGWLWMFSGAILGGLITYLVLLSEVSPTSNLLPTKEKPVGVSNQEPLDEAPSAPAKPQKKVRHFAFYDMLPNSEVPVTATPPSPQAQKVDWEYHIQVASFHSPEDARRVKKQLSDLGLHARIEMSESSSGATWHRLVLGPFVTRSQMEKARSTLRANRYEAMLLKRKKEFKPTLTP